MAGATKTAYHIRAESVEACSCRHACNCQFEGIPTEGMCEFIVGYDVRDGSFGDVSLSGVRAVVVAKYPKAIHEGNGQVVLFVDDRASQAQADAIASIFSGQHGGMPWEALAGTVAKFEGPVRRPVEITIAGERSTVRVHGAVDLQLTPMRDVVSGAEKKVHISYPDGGFLWNHGAIATTDAMHADFGGLYLDWPHRYAAAAEVNWTNQS